MLERNKMPLETLSWDELLIELEKANKRIEAQRSSMNATQGRGGFIPQYINQGILDLYFREKNEIENIINGIKKHQENSNAYKLNEINYTEEILEKFECAIMKEIMTNPVYDPKHPQYKFERLAILGALQNKKENPFTRTPLTKDDLVDDVDLKNEINEFVMNVVGEHNSKNTSKRKSGR